MIPKIQINDEALPLTDVISCVVTEERNGKYELSLVYASDGLYADKIENFAEIIAKPNEDDAEQSFRIYKVSKTITGRLSAYAEHISYKMSDIPVGVISSDTRTAQDALDALKQNAAIECDFTFSSDITTQTSFGVSKPSSLRSLLLGEQGSVLQRYKGEWKFDRTQATLMKSRGKNNGVSLLYGKNITGITYDDNIASVYNGIFPYWCKEVDGTEVVVIPQNPIIYSSNHNSFPYDRIAVVDLSNEFESRPTPADVESAAMAYITKNNIGEPDISIAVSFVPLWQAEGMEDYKDLEKVGLCDTVTIIVPKLNIVTEAKVVETQYNVLKERYDNIKIGTVKKNIVAKIKGDITRISDVLNQLRRVGNGSNA